MSNSQMQKQASSTEARLRKLPFTHGVEIENFITNKQGDILEDGKELVAVWDQMFNGALKFLKSLTSTTSSVPEYIRKKIKRVVRKDVERHGKLIRYVQIHYQINGQTIAINVFGPDPNISQITWLLELVTPPCEYLEEIDWWINTLYLAASSSLTRGYSIQSLGFNPRQSEYRAGVTCGEHHHLGGFKNTKEKKAVYNLIRAYIPHLMALSNTSPFIDGKPSGRIILKKGTDGRTLILAPDCIRSFRLKENSGQLGPNIPEYLPYVGTNFRREQFSRYVRKEIPDDRYVDAFPFTLYGTIELRFFDTQFDQRIRLMTIILLQSIALKAIKIVRTGGTIPEVRGNSLFEHRKRAINFGMFAKFQGDPSIEQQGGDFVKHYNHNPETGGPPGKIFESLRSLVLWLKEEFLQLKVTEVEIAPLLIMLWGTNRIAPPISPTTFMFYLYEQNNSVAKVINRLGLINGKPCKSFCELLGRPTTTFQELFMIKTAKPKTAKDSTKSLLARKLQQDSRTRRKKVMAKERARLKAKQALKTKMLREQMRREKELERKRQERLQRLEKIKRPPPKPVQRSQVKKLKPTKIPPPKKPKKLSSSKPITKTKIPSRSATKKPIVKTQIKPIKKQVKKPSTKKTPQKKQPTTLKVSQSSKKKKVITKQAIAKHSQSLRRKTTTPQTKPKAQAYASSVSATKRYTARQISLPKPVTTKRTVTPKTIKKKATTRTAIGVVKKTAITPELVPFRNTKIIRNIFIMNCPTKIDYNTILPVIKIKWKRSLIQSLKTLPVNVEAEVEAIRTRTNYKKRVFQEKIILERASLLDSCFLPIPIDLGIAKGEFRIKFIVRDLQKRRIIAIDYLTITKNGVATDRKHTISKLKIPPNQIGDSTISIQIQAAKKNLRGKLALLGVSQRGIIKLYEKKAKFQSAKFSLDIPVVIPASICSSNWYVFATFSARGASATALAKASPPLVKVINISLRGTPPLKLRVQPGFISEITPKITFKTRCELNEIQIYQLIRGTQKLLKKYRIRARIRKGESFVLESFTWKAPSLRRSLFRKEKQKIVRFCCVITDSIGRINDSLINLSETPTITIYQKK
ncbi:hypothetical protein DRO91_03500 [Candidatus Heimdallarchaeota archaeon]|nr:MAG: hypothetical protein DRO91_03500 [Candidatus Heimdallarchaeota archaeon]